MNDFAYGLFGIIILSFVIFAVGAVITNFKRKRLQWLHNKARTLESPASITFSRSNDDGEQKGYPTVLLDGASYTIKNLVTYISINGLAVASLKPGDTTNIEHTKEMCIITASFVNPADNHIVGTKFRKQSLTLTDGEKICVQFESTYMRVVKDN